MDQSEVIAVVPPAFETELTFFSSLPCSVLEPPVACSKTIRTLSSSLTALDNALNRSDLWTALDTSKNVTCLAPNSAAFAAAGNPDASLGKADLQKALLFHTLPQPLYSNYIRNGTIIKSLSNDSVLITIRGSDIYFNDAKVIAQNVL